MARSPDRSPARQCTARAVVGRFVCLQRLILRRSASGQRCPHPDIRFTVRAGRKETFSFARWAFASRRSHLGGPYPKPDGSGYSRARAGNHGRKPASRDGRRGGFMNRVGWSAGPQMRELPEPAIRGSSKLGLVVSGEPLRGEPPKRKWVVGWRAAQVHLTMIGRRRG